MSSHHTIRENQEPAVCLLDAKAISIHILQDVLEWSPLLICSASCLPWVLSHDLKVDAVIAPKEKHEALLALLAHQQPVSLIEEKSSCLKSGLSYIQSTQNPSCYIFSNWDSLPSLSDDTQLYTSKITWINGQCQGFLLNERTYHKWYAAGTQIEIKPMSPVYTLWIDEEKQLPKSVFNITMEENKMLNLKVEGRMFLVESLQ